ncbi:protein Lilipod [Trichogramma pretiosum]|uniref:Protein LMBR1L n=1 Tax=Trichogramma kaykai TaxID=54128 RepID=A0ABD2WQP0_9HYME|nr:protein Lilipod [Trichogramma pretiosum]
MEGETDPREQLFQNTIREYTICLLLFLILYTLSYILINRLRPGGGEDYYENDDDDVLVYRISLWLCATALAISIGATLLLPVSIASNEFLLLYPDSCNVEWLNSSLIQGLWNFIFLLSNLSLFVFLPFAYLFTESEGFLGNKKGVMAKVYETITILSLLGAMILGMTYILSAVLDHQKSSLHNFFNLWNYYLTFLYSCVSFIGVVMLLLCTPIGYVKLFGIVGSLLVKPQFLKNIDEAYYSHKFEEEFILYRLKSGENGGKVETLKICPELYYDGLEILDVDNDSSTSATELTPDDNTSYNQMLNKRLQAIQKRKYELDKQRQTGWVRRTFFYPVSMLALLMFSMTTGLITLQNTLQLLVGIKALPISTSKFTLGISSLSKLGPLGAGIQVILILYLAVTSAVGLYSLPGFEKVRPELHSTPITHLIANCAALVVLSSALPLLSRMIGITNFDLLGDYGRIEWLGSFKLVLIYNVIFALTAIICSVTKFSAAVRNEVWTKLRSCFRTIFRKKTNRHSVTNKLYAKED